MLAYDDLYSIQYFLEIIFVRIGIEMKKKPSSRYD